MTPETTRTPRTLDDLLNAAHDVTCRECHAEVSVLVSETFAAGAASRASPEEGRARAALALVEFVYHGTCGVCGATTRAGHDDACEVGAALRSPPAPTEETARGTVLPCKTCGGKGWLAGTGQRNPACPTCGGVITIPVIPPAPPPEDSGARDCTTAMALNSRVGEVRSRDLCAPRRRRREGGRHE